MTQKTMRTYEVIVCFYILAENEEDAKYLALHQSSEKYVQEPDQLSVYSRRVPSVRKVGEKPIIRERDINRKYWTFTLYKYLVPVMLIINAVDEKAARHEARKACRDLYHTFPIEVDSVSYNFEAEIGEREIQHFQVITRWRIVSANQVPFVQLINILPQELIDVLPSHQWSKKSELKTAYAKYVEPVSNWTFYAVAGDPGLDIFGDDTFLFYGLAIDEGKREMTTVSLDALKDLRRIMGTPIIRDVNFEPTPLSKV